MIGRSFGTVCKTITGSRLSFAVAVIFSCNDRESECPTITASILRDWMAFIAEAALFAEMTA